jgi:hypothetical protein
VSDDRSPIGIVNKEAADSARQRIKKGHMQIIEEIPLQGLSCRGESTA